MNGRHATPHVLQEVRGASAPSNERLVMAWMTEENNVKTGVTSQHPNLNGFHRELSPSRSENRLQQYCYLAPGVTNVDSVAEMTKGCTRKETF